MPQETDPCADIPDAPAAHPYQPVPGERWRTGRKWGTTLVRTTPENPLGELIGMTRTAEQAALVVGAVNNDLIATDRPDGQNRGVWVGRYGDRSACFVFATEIDALRHAQGMHTEVLWVPYEEDAASWRPEEEGEQHG